VLENWSSRDVERDPLGFRPGACPRRERAAAADRCAARRLPTQARAKGRLSPAKLDHRQAGPLLPLGRDRPPLDSPRCSVPAATSWTAPAEGVGPLLAARQKHEDGF
jgi:hypothetical protein